MQIAEQIELLREAKALGVKAMDIVGAGEPTLDPNFDTLIHEAGNLGIHSVVFTHGATRMFQDAKRLERYKDLPISFFIKVWSLNDELQNRYVQGGFKNYAQMRNIALVNLRDLGFMEGNEVTIDETNRRLTRVAADILVMKSNAAEIPDIFRFCRGNNIMPEIKNYIPEGPTRFDYEQGYFNDLSVEKRAELKSEEIDQKDFAELRRRLQKIDAEEYGNPSLPYFYPQAVFCTQSMAALYVTIRGDILGCVGTDHVYGKYQSGQDMLVQALKSRKENVSLGCAPRVREANNRNIVIPPAELEILSLDASAQKI